MNALLKKEIRLLLPNFAIAGALTATLLFLPNAANGLQGNWFQVAGLAIVCPLVVMALVLSSFGGEVNAGTFALLLAQPVSRQKIWDTKIAVLACSLAILGLLWTAFAAIHALMSGSFFWWLQSVTIAGGFLLAVCSGGLWTVLLLRQMAAAFWITLLIPFALLIVSGLLADCDENLVAGIQVIVMGLYSLAGFFLARWLFFRAQDVAWAGGVVTLPEMRGLARFRSGGLRRAWQPKMALLWKELQLHQAQYIVAGILVVLDLISLAIRHEVNFRRNSDTLFVLENVWVFCLVLPMLLGCAAVAEERKLGTLAGQACQPVRQRTQFIIKALVVLGWSLCFGVGLPLLLEGDRLLQMSDLLLKLPIMAVGIAGIAFYVSTLTRNLLQSMAPAIMGIALAGYLLVIAPIPWQWQDVSDFLWRGPVVYFIALPIMLATLLVLAYRNFQQVQITRRQVGGNLLALAGSLALGILATAAVYHRGWEKLTPFEPSHGPARLSLSAPPRLSCLGQETIVRFPGGQIWTASLDFPSGNTNWMTVLLSNYKFVLSQERSEPGSNWLSLTWTPAALVGVQSNGTLWLSENTPTQPDHNGWWYWKRDYLQPFVQFGAESNWSSAAPFGAAVWLVKTDGTLWAWGPKPFNNDYRSAPWPGLHAFAPRRLGIESNWSSVQENSHHYRPSLSKTDGSVWWMPWPTNGLNLLEIEPGSILAAEPGRAAAEFRSVSTLYLGMEFRAGISKDGMFRAYAGEKVTLLPATKKHPQLQDDTRTWQAVDFPIGQGANWLAMEGWGRRFVTLRADGTLWMWTFRGNSPPHWRLEDSRREMQNMVPVRLGTHADWVAIADDGNNLVSLAADGSLWFWPQDSVPYTYDHRMAPLLDMSRKPRLLGNVLSPAPKDQSRITSGAKSL